MLIFIVTRKIYIFIGPRICGLGFLLILYANKFTLKILLTIIVPHNQAKLIINISSMKTTEVVNSDRVHFYNYKIIRIFKILSRVRFLVTRVYRISKNYTRESPNRINITTIIHNIN
jgi:Ni,Fe-hydrogenase I large subunit